MFCRGTVFLLFYMQKSVMSIIELRQAAQKRGVTIHVSQEKDRALSFPYLRYLSEESVPGHRVARSILWIQYRDLYDERWGKSRRLLSRGGQHPEDPELAGYRGDRLCLRNLHRRWAAESHLWCAQKNRSDRCGDHRVRAHLSTDRAGEQSHRRHADRAYDRCT